MFDVHPPLPGDERAVFQIDGNLGGCAGVLEMLIQDAGHHKIRILPALPQEWSTGHIGGVRLRGGMEGRLERSLGKLDRFTVGASAARTVTILLGSSSFPLRLSKGESKSVYLREFV